MSRSEELAMLLRVEFHFCEHYSKQYRTNRIEYAAACMKIACCLKAIRKWKSYCVQELEADDYPEEYYMQDPAMPEKKLQVLQTENEYQMSLFDFGGVL